jgi:predicted porin
MFLGCASAPTAYAQSNVSIYGSIDEGITYTSNALGKRTATVAPAAVPDFIGLRGSEDLGDHATAFYAMQQGYSQTTDRL